MRTRTRTWPTSTVMWAPGGSPRPRRGPRPTRWGPTGRCGRYRDCDTTPTSREFEIVRDPHPPGRRDRRQPRPPRPLTRRSPAPTRPARDGSGRRRRLDRGGVGVGADADELVQHGAGGGALEPVGPGQRHDQRRIGRRPAARGACRVRACGERGQQGAPEPGCDQGRDDAVVPDPLDDVELATGLGLDGEPDGVEGVALGDADRSFPRELGGRQRVARGEPVTGRECRSSGSRATRLTSSPSAPAGDEARLCATTMSWSAARRAKSVSGTSSSVSRTSIAVSANRASRRGVRNSSALGRPATRTTPLGAP